MVMQRFRRGPSLALFGWMTLAILAAPAARAQDRPAEKIIDEIRGVEIPQPVNLNRNDSDAVQAFITKRQAATERKARLIGELYQRYPENPELTQLLPERWQALLPTPRTAETAKDEIDRVLATSKNEKLVGEAAVLKVLIAFRKMGSKPNADALLAAVDEFTKRFPKDPRGAEMLYAITQITPDEAKKAAITQRIEATYPDTPVMAMISKTKRLRDAVGKPFEIEFTDAINGTNINSASLKGKVVIVDFWATWCGPCVAEMPKMKSLYAKYKKQGVEFVGVSLDKPRDQGGFDSLKDFVAKNKIEWPQYYEGKQSAAEFATDWGIASIPTVFAIDADGLLATTEARGKLDSLIPELLDKASKGKKTAANP